MHKNFANTLFLGKRVFFLPECHSTNDLLMEMTRKGQSLEGDIVITDHQTAGRGQRGNSWESVSGQNLLFSIHLRPTFLKARDSFLLNELTSVALHKTLSSLISDQIYIKWPNDIYVESRKISGILIQTLLEGDHVKNAIIGIGLNVNQHAFANSNATSIVLESGNENDLHSLLGSFISNFEAEYLNLKAGKNEVLKRFYFDHMYWRGEEHVFRSEEEEFNGEIMGVDSDGRLNVNVGGRLRNYSLKEIEFLR